LFAFTHAVTDLAILKNGSRPVMAASRCDLEVAVSDAYELVLPLEAAAIPHLARFSEIPPQV